MPAAPVPSNKAATPPGAARPITRVSSSLQDRMIGRTVGKCRLLKRLGRGGMGDVYLATHAEMNKSVAVKILPPDLTRNEELLQRFRREAESAGRLEHPNLVEVYDIGEDGGFHFIVMAYVEGMNLQEMLDDAKKLEPREAARIAYEVARGLGAVHADGIVHRDIKPANLLVSSRGEVKIVDFGLAFDSEDKTTLTIVGAVMGTPWYLAPEQAEGKRADLRSDLYSLGICLYLMVTGVRPFTGETHMSVLYKQIHERPKDPRLYVPDLPDYLAETILRALEKKPEKRFASAAEFAQALENFLQGNYPKTPPSSALPPSSAAAGEGKPAGDRSRRASLAAVAAAFLVGLAVAASAFFFSHGSPRPVPSEPGPWTSKPDPVRLERAPVPVPVLALAATDLLSDADRRQIADRDYAPVLKRLAERPAPSPPEKAAIAKLTSRIATAFRVVTRYRATVAAERQPTLRLRDGRVTSYAFVPLSAIHPETIVEYARKSRDISDADAAVFLAVDGGK